MKNLNINIKISLSLVIVVGLTWSYLIHPFLLPVSIHPHLKFLITSALILYIGYLYRTIQFKINLRLPDLIVIALYLAFFTLLNRTALMGSLTSDELYHTMLSSTYHFLPDTMKAHPLLKGISINIINMNLSALVLLIGAGLFFGYKFIRSISSARTRYVLYFISLVIAGEIFHRLPVTLEAHPPMRLFPLFLSQLIFGINDVAFRLPGHLAATFICWLVYRLTLSNDKPSHILPFIFGFSVYMIPTVFHCSVLVHPSIWAFIAGSLCFVLIYKGLETKDGNLMIAAGVSLGLGCLLRQNTMLFWPALILIVAFNRQYWSRLLLIFLPALFFTPYLSTVFHLGHPAARVVLFKKDKSSYTAKTQPASTISVSTEARDKEVARGDKKESEKPLTYKGYRVFGPLRNLIRSTTSLRGPLSVVQSSSLLWTIFFIIGLILTCLKFKSSLRFFYVSFLSGYCLFFAIGPGLWGMGRYQVEYVAPAMMAAILMLIHVYPRKTRVIAGWLVILGIYSFVFNLSIPQDVKSRWPEKRLSTELYTPYKKAFSWIQRQGNNGRILVMDGWQFDGAMGLWMRGFTHEGWRNYLTIHEKFQGFLQENPTLRHFDSFLRENRVDHFVIQYGEKKDFELREPGAKKLLAGLSGKTSMPSYSRQITFSDDRGAAIDIYARSDRKYDWGPPE